VAVGGHSLDKAALLITLPETIEGTVRNAQFAPVTGSEEAFCIRPILKLDVMLRTELLIRANYDVPI
jgi:hypothetical protein